MKKGADPPAEGSYFCFFDQFYQSPNQAKRKEPQTPQPPKKSNNIYEDDTKTTLNANKTPATSRKFTYGNPNTPETQNQSYRFISTPLNPQESVKYAWTTNMNQIPLQKSKQEEKNSKKLKVKTMAFSRSNRYELSNNKDFQVSYTTKGKYDEIHEIDNKNQNIMLNNYYREQNSEPYQIKQLQNSKYDESHNFYTSPSPNPDIYGRNKDMHYREEKAPKTQANTVTGWNLSNFQGQKANKDDLKTNLHEFEKIKPDNLNNSTNVTIYQSFQQNDRPIDYQNRREKLKQEKSKKITKKIKATRKSTPDEASSDKFYYPNKGRYDEIYDFDNKNPYQNDSKNLNYYYREQKHEIPVFHTEKLQSSKYNESYNYDKNINPNLDIYRRDKDYYFPEDLNQGFQATASQSQNIRDFPRKSVEKQENTCSKLSIFNNLNNIPSTNHQSYQQNFRPNSNKNILAREKNLKMINSPSNWIVRKNSLGEFNFKNQGKISKDNLNKNPQIINNSSTNNKQTPMLSNSYEIINDRNQRKFEDDRKNIIHPHNATYDAKRAENSYVYRIACTPTKSLENCNSGLPSKDNWYINSLLQILASTEGFDGIISCINLPFFHALANILKEIKSKSSNLTSALSQCISVFSSEFPIFQGSNQEESKELFQIIFSKFAEAKPTFDLFLIKKIDVFRCEGHDADNSIEKSYFFEVPADKTKSLQDYINSLKKSKRFEGENAMYCDQCDCLKDMTSETKAIETSGNLAFYVDSLTVNFSIQERIRVEGSNYVIYGIICHSGTNISGHYFAYIYSEAERSWVKYDDSEVTFEHPDIRTAYMLFYKNKD